MTHVVCFEGPFPESAGLAWGAAGIDVGGKLVNSITRQSTSVLDLSRLAMEGRVTALRTPIEIDEDFSASPLVVLAIHRDSPMSRLFIPDSGWSVGHGLDRQSKTSYFVFRDKATFDQYAADTTSDVVGYILRNLPAEETGMPALRSALSLSPTDLFLHAIRLGLYGKRNQASELLAEKLMKSDRERRQLRDLIPLLQEHENTAPKVVQWLTYEDGISEGGGLDVSDAATTFTALRSIAQKLKGEVLKVCRFLNSASEVPLFRFAEMQTGSAKIGISIDLPKKPVIERVVRYFAVEAFREVLRGTVPPELTADDEFQNALDKLANPTPDTRLLQRAADEAALAPVIFEPTAPAELRLEGRYRLLVLLEGAYDVLSKIELRLFPKQRATVSSKDNGHGGQPLGVDAFTTTNTFLFRPCIAELVRHTDGATRQRLYLQKLEILEPGTVTDVSEIPSSVVAGAYVRPAVAMRVSVSDDGTVSLGGETIAAVKATSIESENAFLNRYQKVAQDLELDLAGKADTATWIPPVRQRAPNSIARLLLVLATFGGRARLSDLIAEVNARYATSVTRVKIRHDIIANEDLVKFTDEEDEHAVLTDRGRRTARITQLVLGMSEPVEGEGIGPEG
jgi:hypothetical protein